MCATKRIGTVPAESGSSSPLDRLFDQAISEATSLLPPSTLVPTPINSTAPHVERAIVKYYSYGRQLGTLADALSELVELQDLEIARYPRIQSFMAMHGEIEKLKHFYEIEAVKHDAIGVPKWPQVLSTRVYGGAGLPDIEILTVPNYADRKARAAELLHKLETLRSPDSQVPAPARGSAEIEREISVLHSEMLADTNLQVSSIKSEPGAAFAMLLRCLSPTDFGPNERAENTELIVEFARSLYEDFQIPVINSPLSGITLAELASSAVPSAAYLMSQTNPASPEKYIIGVALLGGTWILMGASKGIADGLKTSLEYWVRRILRVPEDEVSLRARTKGSTHALADAAATSPAKKKSAATVSKKSGARNKGR